MSNNGQVDSFKYLGLFLDQMAMLIADNILPLYSFEHVVLLLSQLVAGTVRRRLSGQPHLHFIIQAAGGEHR